MKQELAKKMVEICPEAYIYDDYSGRGMFGSTTTAIVIEDVGILLYSCIANPHLLVDDNGDPLFDENDVQFRFDQFGMKEIIY